MKDNSKDLDEFGKRILTKLSKVDELDPQLAADEKAKFMSQVQTLQKELVAISPSVTPEKADRIDNKLSRKPSFQLFRALVAVILLVIFLAGSSITVFAAQHSLPGEPLYTIKSISEDIRLSMAFTPQAKLDLTLTYTDRRVNEISSLVSSGHELPIQATDRYQQELEHALELAAQMDDPEMKSALTQIKNMAETQGMTVEELLASLPDQASPAIIRLRERLQEQVMLSSYGESDPQAFRNEIKERQQIHRGPKHTVEPQQTQVNPVDSDNTPAPGEESDGSEITAPTELPGHKNPGNGEDQTMPGNGNHGPAATHTPKP